MKKVFSLLLACLMIFSLMSVVSADGEGYTITAGTIDNVKVGKNYVPQYAEVTGDVTYEETTAYDADFNNVLFTAENVALKVVNNNATAGGYIVIDYDETLVTPVTLGADGTEVYRDTDVAGGWISAFDDSLVTLNNSQIINKESTGEILIGWFGANGSVATGVELFYITFLCNEGKSTTDFNADTFKLTSDSSEILTENLLARGAADISSADGATHYDAKQGNISVSFTYPGSDKPVGGNDPVVEESWTVADGNASATVVYDAAVSGKAMIAVYDANGTMIGYTAATEAVTDATSVTISTTYTGTAAQAKVFVWNGYTAAVAAKLWK